ncbi:MAG: hypothetical protein ACI8RD_012345, partial [Bacillariaceae sp.]
QRDDEYPNRTRKKSDVLVDEFLNKIKIKHDIHDMI